MTAKNIQIANLFKIVFCLFWDFKTDISVENPTLISFTVNVLSLYINIKGDIIKFF